MIGELHSPPPTTKSPLNAEIGDPSIHRSMNYLLFTYTNHALERMKDRGVTHNQVGSAVRYPSFVRMSFGNRRVVRKYVGKKILEVVYIKKRGRIIVITVYWVEGK
ncbi:MAG: hypothetical protein KCHDKBKB_02290 [Elusimicrobia bacterium]|nr:hypothetical protein [Elusimicrobiota bacterium]